MLGYALFFTFLASIASLLLVALLLLHKRLIHGVSFYMVSFAAGALLATGFTDTLPEAVKESSLVYVYVVGGVVVFFLIERIFLDIHHHEHEEGKRLRLPIPFLLFGDALHNFIDGISIAATFLVSFPVGVVTSLAVFVHEIPHELGDFGILLHVGYSRSRVLSFNLLTGVTALLGALLGFLLADSIHGVLPVLLSLTTANFIYLSLSDLLPEIHEKTKGKTAYFHAGAFIVGILFIILLGYYFKG